MKRPETIQQMIRYLRSANPNAALKAADDWADFLELTSKDESLFLQSLTHHFNIFTMVRSVDANNQ